MKTTVFFSNIAAILLSSILFLAGCGGVSNASKSAPPSPSTGGSSAHGTFIYVRNDNSQTGVDGTISGFRMNADGTLTALQGSPFAINGNLAVSGNFLLVADSTGMTSYRIDPASGSLTPAAHTAQGANSGGVLFVDPIAVDSRNVYRGSAAWIYRFSIDDSGAFAAMPGSPFFIGGLAVDGIGVRHSTLFASFGSFKFDGLSAYTIQNDGALDNGQSLGAFADSLVVHPNGKFAYAVNGNIERFTIDANGILGQGSSTPPNSGNYFQALAIDPTGKFVAAIDNTSQSITDSHISVFSIDPLTSSLTQLVAPISTGEPLGSSIAFDPSGRFILITHGGNTPFPNDMMVFSFDPASGTAAKIQTAPTGTLPGRVVIATF